MTEHPLTRRQCLKSTVQVEPPTGAHTLWRPAALAHAQSGSLISVPAGLDGFRDSLPRGAVAARREPLIPLPEGLDRFRLPDAQELLAAGQAALWVAGRFLNSARHNLVFENLPADFIRKYRNAGRESKNLVEARRLWEIIPAPIRAAGPEALEKFHQGKDWSHIVPLSADGPTTADNGIWWSSIKNNSLGPREMSPADLASARAALRTEAIRSAVAQTLSGMVKGAILGAVLDASLACLECGLEYVEGKITRSQMVDKVVKATIYAGLKSALITGLIIGIALLFPVLIPIFAPVMLALQITSLPFLGRHLLTLAQGWWTALDGAGKLADFDAIPTVSAWVEPGASSQTVGEDADEPSAFRVRIRNISPAGDPPTLFAPGVWVLHSDPDPFFAQGETDRGAGLETLAEDGGPTKLAAALRAQGLQAGVFDTPVCVDSPGPLQLQSDQTYEFAVTASPATRYLSFATMFAQSNDLFLASNGVGIALFDADGRAVEAQDVTDALTLWDAGAEAKEKPGAGPNQAPRQAAVNSGRANETAVVRPVDDGFRYPAVADLARAYIARTPMVARDQRPPSPRPDYSIGEKFQVGDVQWRVLSVENLGHELKNVKGAKQTTDERFIQVRFQLLNLGSDPLKFDGAPLRDSQGRAYTHFAKQKKFVPIGEKCGGSPGFKLKPNAPTTCAAIYEVKVDAKDLVLATSGLGGIKGRAAATVDLNLSPPPVHSIGKEARVGDVYWKALSAEDLGHVLEANGKKEKTKERFIRVRFQLRNKGSENLNLDVVKDVKLRDNQGREHDHYLIHRPLRPDRYPSEYIPDDEECANYELKPNTMKTCAAIYEVDRETTGLIFVANDLGGTEDGAEIIDLGLPSRMAMPTYFIGEDVKVGDVCWRVLSVEDRGWELRNYKGDAETTNGRFLQVRFRFLNLGSDPLKFDGAPLQDSQGRAYTHFSKQKRFLPENEKCADGYTLKPNAPTICATIYEVEVDATDFIFTASDLEGYETARIDLSPIGSATSGL